MTRTSIFAVVVLGALYSAVSQVAMAGEMAEYREGAQATRAELAVTDHMNEEIVVEDRALAELAPIWMQEYLVLSRYGRDAEHAREVGKKLVANAPADVLHLLAWEIAVDSSLKIRDLDLALELAERARVLTDGQDVDVLDTYARVLYARGNVAEALEQQEQALALCTDSFMREMLVEHLREMGGEIQHLAHNDGARPENGPESLHGMVNAYVQSLVTGADASNRAQLEQGILQFPEPEAAVLSDLSWFLMTTDIVDPDPEFALELAQKAKDLSNGRNADVLDTYALALFVNGDVESAIAYQQEGIKLCTDPELGELMEVRLEFYQQVSQPGGQPVEERGKPGSLVFV